MAKVSVIVPIYNAEKTLAACLGQLVHQTLDDIELILVNDCSTDSSWQIIQACEQQFPEKVMAINSPENRGPGGARNIGLMYAQGEYIGFVDSDDLVDSSMYEKLYNEAKRGDYDIVDTGFYNEAEDRAIVYTSDELKGELNGKKRSELMLCGSYIWSKIYRAELVRALVPFRENIILEDSEWMIDALCSAKRIGNVKECLYIYKNSSDSLSKCTNPEKYYTAVTEAINAVYETASKREDYAEIQEAVECFLLNMGALCLNALRVTGHERDVAGLKNILSAKIKLKKNTYAENKIDRNMLADILKLL